MKTHIFRKTPLSRLPALLVDHKRRGLQVAILMGFVAMIAHPTPALAAGGTPPEEENMPYLMVVRHIFEGEREHLGTIDYKIRSEHGKLYADGRFEDPYVDTGWVMPGKDREHYKTLSGKFLASSYELNSPEKMRAFSTSPGFTPEHVTDWSYLVVEPVRQDPEWRSYSDFITRLQILSSEMIEVVRDQIGKILSSKTDQPGVSAGRAPVPKVGWQFFLTDAAAAVTQTAFTLNGADMIKLGNRCLEESMAMRLSGDPEMERAGAALDHLGLWLSALGYKALTATSPVQQAVSDRFNQSLETTPEPQDGTTLIVGTAFWIWHNGSWHRGDLDISKAVQP